MILGSLVKAAYNRTQLRLISLFITGTMQTKEIGWRKQMLKKALGPRFDELGMDARFEVIEGSVHVLELKYNTFNRVCTDQPAPSALSAGTSRFRSRAWTAER